MMPALNEAWPEVGLQSISTCPYCGSKIRSLAYEGVQDWSFGCAPGKWNYWNCKECQSLYLDPRPSVETIGDAYRRYYTHTAGVKKTVFEKIKERLRNECLSQTLEANITPRLNLPHFFGGLVARIAARVHVPFGALKLANNPKGKFIDIGCGAGATVVLASQLGWDAMGLEVDEQALIVARGSGLRIIEGGYHKLDSLNEQFNAIMCSHVLEHVHDPLQLLDSLKNALKPGGMLLLILPNAASILRQHFGADWRGLEAPRHLSLPTESRLVEILASKGFSVVSESNSDIETAAESFRIRRRGAAVTSKDLTNAKTLRSSLRFLPGNSDFIKLFCVLSNK